MQAVVATDVIANELAVRLFLFGLAAMSFYEALKLESPRSYVAWLATTLFFLSAVALTPIFQFWPTGVTWLVQLVADPVSWFLLAMSSYLILRPRLLVPTSDHLDNRAPVYDDSELRGKVERVTASLNAIHAVKDHEPDIAALRASLSRVDELVTRWHKEEITEKAAPIIARMQDIVDRRMGPTDMGPGPEYELLGYEVLANDSRALLRTLGISDQAIQSVEAPVVDAVQSSPIHLTLSEREKADATLRARASVYLEIAKNPMEYLGSPAEYDPATRDSFAQNDYPNNPNRPSAVVWVGPDARSCRIANIQNNGHPIGVITNAPDTGIDGVISRSPTHKFHPDSDCSEFDEGHVVFGMLFVPGCDGTVVFDFTEESLDRVA